MTGAIVKSSETALAELAEKMIPVDRDKAKNYAKILFGSYPWNDVPDPEIYSRSIISLFERFPAWACKEAVDRVTLKAKSLPSRAVVFAELEAVVAEFKTEFLKDLKRPDPAMVTPEERKAIDDFKANGGREKMLKLKEEIAAAALATQQKEKQDG